MCILFELMLQKPELQESNDSRVLSSSASSALSPENGDAGDSAYMDFINQRDIIFFFHLDLINTIGK